MEQKVKALENTLQKRSELVTSLYLKVKQQKEVIKHLEETRREQDHTSVWYAYIVDTLQSELLETQAMYNDYKSKYENIRKELENIIKQLEK